MARTLTYFIADVHLGLRQGSWQGREQRFVSLLNSLAKREDTLRVVLLGDIFDFWFEYKYLIPQGYTRALGAIATLADSGVEVHFIPGNHDVWTFGFLEKELGVKVHTQDIWNVEFSNKKFALFHGDIPQCFPPAYRFMRFLFRNYLFQRLFACLPTRVAYGFGHKWSSANRKKKKKEYEFKGESEPLYRFSSSLNADYVIMGHLHTSKHYTFNNKGEFYILGDWINGGEYLVFDGNGISRCVL